MIFFGHVGPTVAAARAADRDIDLRLPALLSVAPDLIDKPIVLLFPALVNENTRSFAHSLLGSLAVLALLLAFRRRVKRPFLLWACYLGHFVLDRMWLNDNPAILFWPFLGALPASEYGGEIVGVHLLTPYNIAGEAIGLSILLYMVYKGYVRKPRVS